MKSQLVNLLERLAPLARWLKRYLAVLFVVVVVVANAALLYRVNRLLTTAPSDEDVSAKLQTVKRPRLDQQAAAKIQQLQAQNVEVKALFDKARNNPFNEP